MSIVKRLGIFFVLLFSISSFNSCFDESQNMYPPAIGRQRELLVVMNESAWQSKPGELIKNLLAKDVPALPQSEPEFNISQMPATAFSDIMKRSKNLIIVKFSNDISTPEFSVSTDKWAKPQVIVSITAKNYDDFEKIFTEKSEKIYNVFDNEERNRLILAYTNEKDVEISNVLKSKFNVSISIPQKYELFDNKENFCWIKYETQKLIQGILIWDYPYKDTSDLSAEKIIMMRDSITKLRVPGPQDGSYMTTEKEATFEHRDYMFKDRYNVEIKGLWKLVRPGFMGGPFMSITTVDQKRNRVITIDGFVYAGKEDKRNYIKQLEAIFYTLDIE